MLDLVTGIDKDEELTYDILKNHMHPVTQLLLIIYSLESFIYKSLNKACRLKDSTKIDTLGPYAHVMSSIEINTISGKSEEAIGEQLNAY
jgi:hypothetical protein